jgi:uncharacterized protein YrzB (UPF0473 family)
MSAMDNAAYILIPDDNGIDTKYEIVAEVEHEGKDYMFVSDNGEDVYCFSFIEDGGDIELTAISGNELEVMQKILDKLWEIAND